MNKGVKITLVVSLCCFFLGIMIVGGCAVAARAMGDAFRWPNDGDYNWNGNRDRGYEGAGVQSMDLETVNRVELNLAGEPVSIEIGGEKPALEWRQARDNQYRVRQDANGDLFFSREESIRNNWGIFWRRGFYFNFDGLRDLLRGDWPSWNFIEIESGRSRDVVLTLPEGHPAIQKLTINAVSSTVAITGLTIDRMEADGMDIRLELADCAIDRLGFNSVNGKAILTGGGAREIAADGMDIRLELADCAIDRLAFNSVKGSAVLTGGEARKITADGMDAKVTAHRAAGLEDVSLSGVNVRFEGTLLGESADYRFSADGLNAKMTIGGLTANGGNTVGGGSRHISVEGLNASLKVTFEDAD